MACHQSHARFARGAYHGFRRRLPVSFFFHVNCWLNHEQTTKCQIYLTSSCLPAPPAVPACQTAARRLHARLRDLPARPPARACCQRCAPPPARRALYATKTRIVTYGDDSHIFAAAVCSISHKLFPLSNPISHTTPASASHQRPLPKLPLFPQRGSRSRQKNNEAIAHGLVFPLSDNLNASRPRYLFVSTAQNRLTNNARYGTIEP